MNDEIYLSIKNSANIGSKVLRSKFFAEVHPISSEQEAEECLNKARAEYFDATHHCYAYAIGNNRTPYHYSDDGEPSGTAGIKIFAAIQSKNVSDIIVIVSRYFGGTKLGVGGLGRAYFESAVNVLHQTELVTKAVMRIVKIEFPFAETNPVMHLMSIHKLKIINTKYDESKTVITVLMPSSQVSTIQELLTNATKAYATMNIEGTTTIIL